MIKDDNRLLWYLEGRFTAEDMTRGTGLSERSQRTLAKLGILQPIPQARTAPRLFDARMFKRAALVAPLIGMGLSLEVAGTIVYAAPSLESFTFLKLDPWKFFFGEALPTEDGKAPPINPYFGKFTDPAWYDPAIPPAPSGGDVLIEIVNGRYVVCAMVGPPDKVFHPNVYGELSADMTRFLWWAHVAEVAPAPANTTAPITQDVQIYGRPTVLRRDIDHSIGEKIREWHVRTVPEDEQRAVEAMLTGPLTKMTLNASFTLRTALRRLLYIDPV